MHDTSQSPERMLLHKAGTAAGFIRGYASVFHHLDRHGDRVQPGAFKVTLNNWYERGQLPKMLWQHDAAQPIGQWLKMKEDAKGLYVEGQLILDIRQGREAHALIQAGVVDALSIGYRVDEAVATKSGERLLTKVSLEEVSIVTFASNTEASLLKLHGDAYSTEEADALINALQRATYNFKRL